MKNPGTLIPIIGFLITLGIVVLDIAAADGPLSQAHRRATEYGHALAAGDVDAARDFHVDGGPGVPGLVSTLEDGVFWIDSASVESGRGGDERVTTTLVWETGSGSGQVFRLTLEWALRSGIWEIVDSRTGLPGA